MKLQPKYFVLFSIRPWWIILLLISQLSCDTTEPTDNLKPGKRDYAWSIDSTSTPGIPFLQSIWGSAPTDVWGAGFSEDVRDCLWHFDGTSWKRATEGTPITEFGNGSKIVGGVWGTAQNDVWAFGGRIISNPLSTEPFIMHYDGIQWTEVLGDKSQMPDGFTDIYPIRKNQFWVSSFGHVSEYKDGTWKKYFIGENYFVQSIEGVGHSVYLTAYLIGIDSLYLMKFSGSKFIVIDQTKLLGDGKFEQNGLLFTNDKTYTFGGNGVFTANLNGEDIILNTWKNELHLQNNMGFRNSYKNNFNDIWGIGSPSIIFQFNGRDWQQLIIDVQNLVATFTSVWGNGDEIFISDTENKIIYHGK